MASTPEIGSAASAQIKAAEEAAQRIVKAHSELHHYTGAVGLKGIVESNSMWATYFADMNDAQEIISTSRARMVLAAPCTWRRSL
jgi:hypothetical protein